jgi:uncharacterized protein YoaH (UPF0181 family)
MTEKETGDAKQFVKDHWPKLLAAGMTVAGIAIWLTAEYLRAKKVKDDGGQLDIAEEMAMGGGDPSATLLEGADVLGGSVGVGAKEAAKELAGEVPDEKVADALNAVSHNVPTRRGGKLR